MEYRMLIKDLLVPENQTVLLKTKVVKCLEMSFDDFIRQYNSHRYSGQHREAYLEEYNHLLYQLCISGCINLSDNTYSNGVKHIISIDPEYLVYLRDETISVFGREKKDVDYNVNLRNAVVLFNTFSNDYGTTVPVDTFVAVNFLRKQIQCAERGVDFHLTFSEMKKLMTRKRCFYSGVELTLDGVHSVSLDRIDSCKGYTFENTVACSQYVNQLKNKLIESKDDTKHLTDTQLKTTLQSFISLL